MKISEINIIAIENYTEVINVFDLKIDDRSHSCRMNYKGKVRNVKSLIIIINENVEKADIKQIMVLTLDIMISKTKVLFYSFLRMEPMKDVKII